MAYSFVICTASGEPVGEVYEAHSRSMAFQRNGVHQADITLSLRDELTNYCAPGLTRLKVYRSRTAEEIAEDPTQARELVFYGSLPPTGMREQGSNGTVSLTFRDPRWVFSYRYTLGNNTYNNVDEGEILWGLVDAQNARADMWLTQGITSTGILRTRQYADRRRLQDVFDEATRLQDGVDVDVSFVDGSELSTPSRQMGVLNIYTEQGQDRPQAVFIYGGPNLPTNVADMTRSYLDVITANQSTASGIGSVDLTSTYTVGATSPYGLLEEYGGASDVSTQAQLDAYVVGRVLARQAPRQVVDVSDPSPEAPQPFVDYYLGDRVRATCQLGSMKFDNQILRVDQIGITLSDTGRESVSLTMSDPSLDATGDG